MRILILFLASTIMALLIISTFTYEKQAPITLPQLADFTDVDEEEEPAEVTLEPVTQGPISYTLQEDELKLTYNGGADWMKVPVDKASLFRGEYQGNETELMMDSYVLTEDLAAFIYAEETNEEYVESVGLVYSFDQGETWKDSVINEGLSSVRFRKIDFVTDTFAYAILSGGRTMSQEFSSAYISEDRGETWKRAAEVPTTRLIAFGTFVDEEIGFLSYGTIDPTEPDMYVTQDAGETWLQAEFDIPEKYQRIFVQAEEAVKEEGHLLVLLNQGPNGDYAGGKVKAAFISEDNGLTWKFDREVEPNETR